MVAIWMKSNMTKTYDLNMLYKASWFQSLLDLLWYSDSSYPIYYCVLKGPVTIGNFLFTMDSSVDQTNVGPAVASVLCFFDGFESNTHLKHYSCDVLVENILDSNNVTKSREMNSESAHFRPRHREFLEISSLRQAFQEGIDKSLS